MYQVRLKVMSQKTDFMRDWRRFSIIFVSTIKILLGDFNTKLGRELFSNRQLGIRMYIRIVMIMVLD